MQETPELPFITNEEVATACFNYNNEESINAPQGELKFTLLPGSRLGGTMTMLVLFGNPKKGTLTILKGEVSADKLQYRFTAEGYIVEFGTGKKIHVGPLDMALDLDAGGQKGTLIGLMTGTVAKATPCHS